MHQTILDRICPENWQQRNIFFYLTYTCLKILKKLWHTEDEKLQLQYKYQLIQSYKITIKNQTVHRAVLEWNLRMQNNNFLKPKWVKLDTLLKIPETKLKTKPLVCKRTQIKSKVKTTGLPPIKRFLYSHIASLTYLVSRWLEWGGLASPNLNSCTYLIYVGWA